MNFAFLQSKRVLLLWGGVLILLVAAILGVIFYTRQSRGVLFKKTTEAVVDEPRFYSALNGVPVAAVGEQYPTVVGVMIDNHFDARPQSGLDKAGVVYEAPVEGGITRYFALFASTTSVSEVGPVRSARPYFLDWLTENGDALYVHSGGSPEALQLIKTRNIFDANEFYFGSYFWRDKKRPAPHNLFTSSEGWQQILDKKQPDRLVATREWSGWKFDLPNAIESQPSQILPRTISVAYTSSYTVGWTVTSTGRFVRSINDVPMRLRDGIGIEADTVIFARMDKEVLDGYGRLALTTVSGGEMFMFKHNALITGTWKKSSLAERTRWYDEQGVEVALTPGTIWIQIIPSDATVMYESAS